MNLANKITISRILLVPVFIILVVYSSPGKNIFRHLAILTFCVAAVSDAVDGFIARNFGQKTEFGAYIDALADKILIDSSFILLSFLDSIPIWLTIVVISRDILILGGVALLHIHIEEVEISPTITSKVTTFFQMLTIIAVLLNHRMAPTIWNLAAFFTIISGIGYIIIANKKLSGI